MPSIAMTSHLYRFFPALEDREILVPAGTVAEALKAVDVIAPGFSDYLVDERGHLRRHVNICINEKPVIDRQRLSDYIADGNTLFIFQALSGG